MGLLKKTRSTTNLGLIRINWSGWTITSVTAPSKLLRALGYRAELYRRSAK